MITRILLAGNVDQAVWQDGDADAVVGGQVHVGPHLLSHAELQMVGPGTDSQT